MRRRSILVLVLFLGACVPSPIAPPVQRTGTTVNASFGKAWNAVIDVFAERNIPIKTIDRSSGLIVTEQLSIAPGSMPDAADCGTDVGSRVYPTNANYNVLVRGDSSSTVVKVTPRFVRAGPSRGLIPTGNVTEECSSKGVWEAEVEQRIKAIAERVK